MYRTRGSSGSAMDFAKAFTAKDGDNFNLTSSNANAYKAAMDKASAWQDAGTRGVSDALNNATQIGSEMGRQMIAAEADASSALNKANMQAAFGFGNSLLERKRQSEMKGMMEKQQSRGSFGGIGKAVGALAGSFVPGIGTAMGATIGGGIGSAF